MGTDSASSVHSQATSGSSPNPVCYAVTQRKRCGIEFIASQLLYRSFDAIEGTNREERLLSCRSAAWFVRSRTTGLVRVASNHCRLRWCPLCARSRSGFITAQVKDWFRDTHQPKLLTLTVKHTRNPISEQLKHIYNSFRGLRRSKFWKDLAYGGVWFFQITYNRNSNQWHPHIHVLLDSEYIPYLKLRQKWHYYTSGSDILDIRSVFNTDDMANYVARYAARPHQLNDLPIDRARDMVTALHGKRMCGSFGSAKSIRMTPYNNAKTDEWQNLGSWVLVHNLAKIEESARQILLAYHTNQPLDPCWNVLEFEEFIDGKHDVEPDVVLLDPHPPPASLFPTDA